MSERAGFGQKGRFGFHFEGYLFYELLFAVGWVWFLSDGFLRFLLLWLFQLGAGQNVVSEGGFMYIVICIL